MRLWRLTRSGRTALDGAGTLKHGGRYSPPGVPVVSFASEAGLAVLGGSAIPAVSQPMRRMTTCSVGLRSTRLRKRGPLTVADDAIREWVTDWLKARRSLLAAVHSQVLPEADIVLMNALHPDAAHVKPLVTRPFSFAECLTLRRCWRATPLRARVRCSPARSGDIAEPGRRRGFSPQLLSSGNTQLARSLRVTVAGSLR